MQIDIIKIAEVLAAGSAILAAIIGAYKLYDKLIDELADLKKRVAALEADNDRIKKEDTLVIYALRACLDGLHQKGCNGRVTEAIQMIDKHINKAAHDQE
nr:branched-chain amino acid ABC transporter permease [uncultured Ruminococcus sp.]